MKRCKLCNPRTPLYVEYHEQNGSFDDKYLFEILILELF